MAVGIRTTDFPEGVGTAVYDSVQAKMDLESNPPEGLLFHWAGDATGPRPTIIEFAVHDYVKP